MLIAALALTIQEPQPSGVWEKLIAPGLTYHMEVAPGPLLINAVRVTTEAEGVNMVGELANGKVFDPESATQGRETVSATAARKSALVTVNADFFPFTGDPLGAMVRDGELLSSPQNGRAAFCWGEGFSQAAYLTFAASLTFEGQSVPIFGVNQECGENMVVLNTPAAGHAISREPATHAVLVLVEPITPSGQWRPRVRRVVESATSVQVNDDEIVLTFRGSVKERLTFLNAGDEVDIRTDCKGADWRVAKNVVAGGPFLVKGGKAFVPYSAEGFTDGFAKNKHPRTAVGRTKDGDVWIVTVDGRQAMSAGATLSELADVMLRLGCTEAINLDGGGSTTLNLGGLTVNRPSEGTERAIANAVLVFSSSVQQFPVPVGEPEPVIAGPATIKAGGKGSFRMVDSSGADVPNSEVFWSAQGAGWIDQSGVLRGAAEGTCRIHAYSHGRLSGLTVTIEKG
jgi:exopolysaccharide biosynthesis protein